MLQRAAERGYARAQAALARKTRTLEWAEKSAAQGDREGICRLAVLIATGVRESFKDPKRALELYRQEAELGSARAQHSYGELAFDAHAWERYRWWGRAAARGLPEACADLAVAARQQLRLLEGGGLGRALRLLEGGGLGRAVYEIGLACKGRLSAAEQRAFGRFLPAHEVECLERAVNMYDTWSGEARRAVECFPMVAHRYGVVRDIRVVISRMAWRHRFLYVPGMSIEGRKGD